MPGGWYSIVLQSKGLQAHGLRMLREAVSRSAACAGAPGAHALRALDAETFDLLASDSSDFETDHTAEQP